MERSGRAHGRRIKREKSNGAAGAGPHPATCDDARGERRRALLSRASCAASLAENATTVTAANKARIEEDTWPMTQTMTPTRLLEIHALRGI